MYEALKDVVDPLGFSGYLRSTNFERKVFN